MLTEWISLQYFNKQTTSKKKFKAAKPYPHLILKDFFNQTKLETLRAALLAEPFEHIDKDLFSFENTKDLAASNNHAIQEFYKFFSSNEFKQFMQQITGEKLGSISDMHGHIFKQGDYLLFHDDKVEKRRIAYVINLSKAFTKKDGGRFMMYDVKRPQKHAVAIVPQFNTFVCFKVSARSLHAVEEVLSDKKRMTIGGWFYGN
ncbi:2OG-Fe(II) oxygenase [Candidatus Woesearchaeota archaeon]|nr:2OG-Fe(II) oxygenase [Candidatus Woesearchaeota archaeon]